MSTPGGRCCTARSDSARSVEGSASGTARRARVVRGGPACGDACDRGWTFARRRPVTQATAPADRDARRRPRARAVCAHAADGDASSAVSGATDRHARRDSYSSISPRSADASGSVPATDPEALARLLLESLNCPPHVAWHRARLPTDTRRRDGPGHCTTGSSAAMRCRANVICHSAIASSADVPAAGLRRARDSVIARSPADGRPPASRWSLRAWWPCQSESTSSS